MEIVKTFVFFKKKPLGAISGFLVGGGMGLMGGAMGGYGGGLRGRELWRAGICCLIDEKKFVTKFAFPFFFSWKSQSSRWSIFLFLIGHWCSDARMLALRFFFFFSLSV
jgi:hypothetical protein